MVETKAADAAKTAVPAVSAVSANGASANGTVPTGLPPDGVKPAETKSAEAKPKAKKWFLDSLKEQWEAHVAKNKTQAEASKAGRRREKRFKPRLRTIKFQLKSAKKFYKLKKFSMKVWRAFAILLRRLQWILNTIK